MVCGVYVTTSSPVSSAPHQLLPHKILSVFEKAPTSLSPAHLIPNPCRPNQLPFLPGTHHFHGSLLFLLLEMLFPSHLRTAVPFWWTLHLIDMLIFCWALYKTRGVRVLKTGDDFPLGDVIIWQRAETQTEKCQKVEVL